MHDFAALFKHGSLIFAYRYSGGFKSRYVRRLAYRIAQKAYGNAVFKVAHFDFRFDRRVALEPRQRYEVHVVERKLGKLGNGGLNENSGFFRVDSACEIVKSDF